MRNGKTIRAKFLDMGSSMMRVLVMRHRHRTRVDARKRIFSFSCMYICIYIYVYTNVYLTVGKYLHVGDSL